MGWIVSGSNPIGWWDFLHLSGPALGPTQSPTQCCTRSFLGVKQLECGADNRPPSSTEVKERVELYLYSPSGPSWPALGQNLPFQCLFIKASFWTASVVTKSQFAPGKFREAILYRTATVVPKGGAGRTHPKQAPTKVTLPSLPSKWVEEYGGSCKRIGGSYLF
jgi:hypothetical protein